MPPEPSPFAFSQIAEMNSTPADIPIPELENLRRGLAPAFAPTQQLTGQEETARALANMRDMQSHLVMANQAAQRPPQPTKTTIKTDPDGNKHISIEGPAELAEYYGKAGQFYQQAMGGMQQEMERLKAQETQARSQPWAQLATALSANLAQAPNLPGWVQAAGRTAAQLNPTADQLRNQRLVLAERGAGIAERGLALGLHQQQIAEQTAQRNATQAVEAEKQRRLLVEKARDNLAQSIGKGIGQLDVNAATSMLAEAGAKPKETAAVIEDLRNLAGNVGTAYALAREDKAEAGRRADTTTASLEKLRIATMASLATKAKEKSLEEKGIEAIAQSLANGELTAIRDVSSMRGVQRSAIFARARELNPQFSTGEIQRKIKMEDSFTNGPKGAALVSFDTFLQHAAGVSEAMKNIQMTDSALLNKSLNWWRKNMKGTPELARLETSLEPVGKEFEKFLLATGSGSGGALYVDDRRKVDDLLNPNKPLNVQAATLSQMGETARDKFTALNQQYKRVMKQDIPHAFSAEAISGAAKIGVNLPVDAESVASGDPLEGRTATGPDGKKIVRRNGQWVPM